VREDEQRQFTLANYMCDIAGVGHDELNSAGMEPDATAKVDG
jgi:hypothetical protein